MQEESCHPREKPIKIFRAWYAKNKIKQGYFEMFFFFQGAKRDLAGDLAAGASSDGCSLAKRPRGRPPGSKNKRKRGRPRKETSVHEQTTKEKEIDIDGEKWLCMSKFQCFICEVSEDSTGFENMQSMCEHFIKCHTQVNDDGVHVLLCKHCTWNVTFSSSNFAWQDMADVLSRYFPHLVDVHCPRDFEAPDYVSAITCPFSHCNHTQYSLYQMRIHLKWVHKEFIFSLHQASSLFPGLVDASRGQMNDSWAENSLEVIGLEEVTQDADEISIPGQLKPKFSQLQCFLCAKLSECFASRREFIKHLKMDHMAPMALDQFILQCPFCPKLYAFPRKHLKWESLFESFGSLLTHLATVHSSVFNVPSFISQTQCPHCDFKEFTIQAMRQHLRTLHNVKITDWQTAIDFFPWLRNSQTAMSIKSKKGACSTRKAEAMVTEGSENSRLSVSKPIPQNMGCKLSMSKCACFLCDKHPLVFESDHGLQQHISDVHVLYSETGEAH
jgi:hypothetical protein